MRLCCLSKKVYSGDGPFTDTPEALCGGRKDALGDLHISRVGYGAGLVHPNAISPEFHCRKCYVGFLRDEVRYRNPPASTSTTVSVSAGKPDVGQLVHAGQEAALLKQRSDYIQDLEQKIKTLEYELKLADRENDRLCTENLKLKAEKTDEARRLWDEMHAVLTKTAPGNNFEGR